MVAVIESRDATPYTLASEELVNQVLAMIPEIVYERGMQVAYVPKHARNPNDRHDASHPDVEFGFVTSVGADANKVKCRFWRKMERGEKPTGWEWIRTKANSEVVDASDLLHLNRTTPQLIEGMLEYIDNLEDNHRRG
jgi:hypothetical protein